MWDDVPRYPLQWSYLWSWQSHTKLTLWICILSWNLIWQYHDFIVVSFSPLFPTHPVPFLLSVLDWSGLGMLPTVCRTGSLVPEPQLGNGIGLLLADTTYMCMYALPNWLIPRISCYRGIEWATYCMFVLLLVAASAEKGGRELKHDSIKELYAFQWPHERRLNQINKGSFLLPSFGGNISGYIQ